MSFFTRSRMCPTDASTAYWRPRNFFSVRVLAGLSTISRFLATVLTNAAGRPPYFECASRDGLERGQYHRPADGRKERDFSPADSPARAGAGRARRAPARAEWRARRRSEEHTSELQ